MISRSRMWRGHFGGAVIYVRAKYRTDALDIARDYVEHDWHLVRVATPRPEHRTIAPINGEELPVLAWLLLAKEGMPDPTDVMIKTLRLFVEADAAEEYLSPLDIMNRGEISQACALRAVAWLAEHYLIAKGPQHAGRRKHHTIIWALQGPLTSQEFGPESRIGPQALACPGRVDCLDHAAKCNWDSMSCSGCKAASQFELTMPGDLSDVAC